MIHYYKSSMSKNKLKIQEITIPKRDIKLKNIQHYKNTR